LNILKSYFQIKKDDQEILIKKKIEDKVHDLDEKLKNILPPLFDILSLKVKDEAYSQLDPGLKKIRTFEALSNLFIRESQNKPLIVAVEDLHWIDKITEEFLDYLIGWISNTRILLILLYRPEYTHQWGSKSYYTRIGVAQLPRESSIELVQAILKDGKLENELQNLILGRTGGNPLFAEELTLNLMENGCVEKHNDTYVLSGKTADIRVPDSIQGIIAARIDRLNESLKEIMQVAAVIGREFAFHILQAITGMQEELKSGLFSLQGMEFISEKRLFPELEYLFKHALTQEVAYNSLLLKKRREIHEKIGNAIEKRYTTNLEEHYELLAYHYRRSANAQKALEYLDLANQKAIKLNAVEEGKAYFDDAMRLLDTMPENKETQQQRVTLLVNQWTNFFLLFKFSEYLDLLNKYEPAAVSLDNPQILGMYYVRIAQCLWWSGHLDQVLQKGTKAYRLCEEAGNLEGAGSASLMLQWSYLYKGDFHKVLELKENSLRMMKKQFNLRQYVWTLSVVSLAHTRLCHWDEALKEGLEGLRMAEKIADRSMTSFAAHTISTMFLAKGDLAQANKYAELSSREAPTPADKAWSQNTLAHVWCLTGETGKGVKVLETLAKMAHDFGNVINEVDNLMVLGEGYNLAGDYDRAKQVLKECLELTKRCGMKFFLAEAYRLLGENYLETDPSRAESRFNKSLDIFKEIEAKNELAKTYHGLGLLFKHQGQITRAREYFKEALDIFDLIGISKESEKIKNELATLPEK
jgi:tetratricopeptide (TPR) repeat protein